MTTNTNHSFESALRYHQTGELTQAKALYQAVLAENPAHMDSLHLLGLVEHQLGSTAVAINYLSKATALAPKNPIYSSNLGAVLTECARYDEALPYLQNAIKASPNNPNFLCNLGNAYQDLEDIDRAFEQFTAALAINPVHLESLIGLSGILIDQHHYDEALSVLSKAEKMNPYCEKISLNLAKLYHHTGQISEAMTKLETLIEQSPSQHDAKFNLSLLALLAGDFERGWALYESRWKIRSLQSTIKHYPYPRWQGEPLDQKKIVLWGEQGIGDQIFFGRFISDLRDQGAEIFLDPDPRLSSLWLRTFPDLTIINDQTALDTLLSPQHIDYHCPLGSLPYYCHQPNTLNHPAYLTACPQRTLQLRKGYQALTPASNRLIGISWHCVKDPLRSIPLERWKALLLLPGISWINLQYGDHQNALETMYDRYGISIHHDPSIDPLNNFDDFSAQVRAMDHVITVDNSTAHLAGALGQSVYTLLPRIPNWRWLRTGSDALWYDTMRLFRQTQEDHWEAVFDEIIRTLSNAPID